ncbi:MAG: 30S ribosomal protein S5 [Nanoarchaeota archaeon]
MPKEKIEAAKDTPTPKKEKIIPVKEEETLIAPEEIKEAPKIEIDVAAWKPKTSLGKRVKNNEIVDIEHLLDSGATILEPEIIDILLPGMESDLLLIGQSKGKFGGGQRRVFRQTQKKTREGNKPKFATYAVIGNRDGIVGLGYGKSKETVPAREKAVRNAKINIFKIRRGSGSWESKSDEPHSIPFKVEGKCGSVRLALLPAPKGTGLCATPEIAKILAFAGIKDIWTQTRGQTKTRTNLIVACERALKQLSITKLPAKTMLHIVDGKAGGKNA